MKKIIIQIISIVILLGLSVCLCSASSREATSLLFEKINKIRQAPYQSAFELPLGYSPEELQEKLRENGIFPETVLPDMEKDWWIGERAKKDFLENFSDSVSGDATEKEQSVSTREYLYSASRSAVISFLNYMPLERACQVFITNIFRKDLDPFQEKTLLFPGKCCAGAYVSSGMNQDGNNAWFFSLQVDGGVLLKEMQLLNLINQVRAYPQLVSFFANERTIARLEQNPHILSGLETGYAPVGLDSELYQEIERIQDIGDMENMEKEDPDVHFLLYDMNPVPQVDGQTKEVLVSEAFAELIEKEFFLWFSRAFLFSASAGGIAPKMEVSFPNDVKGNIVGIREKTEEISDLANLYILAFTDFDRNGVYSPGEEAPGLLIEVYDPYNNLLHSVETDRAGHIDLQLPKFQTYLFRIVYLKNRHTSEKEVFIMEDQFLAFSRPGSKDKTSF